MLKPEAIYGQDNRVEVYAASPELQAVARATAARILDFQMPLKDGRYVLNAPSLSQKDGVCATERFADQPEAAFCTGFLVGEDILVTAGHCVDNVGECKYYSWVFDFAYEQPGADANGFSFGADQLYKCVEIIAISKDFASGKDYAVLKLDRKVTGRVPLQFRKSGKLPDSAKLAVAGNSSGLPAKVADHAVVRQNTDPVIFQLNSDTFHGNSGSPVINLDTGLVEGILTRGDDDYEKLSGESCYKTIVRPENGGRGEDSDRITDIPELQNL